MTQGALPKVLYIEDNPDSRALVRRILTPEYTMLEASEALSGIEAAVEKQPDLILLDFNLPQLSGREVALRLKTLVPNIPVVAFTADASPGARERALAAGCIGYITKPLDVDKFLDQLAEFLSGKKESAANAAEYHAVFQAELVERLEAKVREAQAIAEHNAFLNEQNKAMVALLQRRQKLLEAGARVAHGITSIFDLDELIPSTLDTLF